MMLFALCVVGTIAYVATRNRKPSSTFPHTPQDMSHADMHNSSAYVPVSLHHPDDYRNHDVERGANGVNPFFGLKGDDRV